MMSSLHCELSNLIQTDLHFGCVFSAPLMFSSWVNTFPVEWTICIAADSVMFWLVSRIWSCFIHCHYLILLSCIPGISVLHLVPLIPWLLTFSNVLCSLCLQCHLHCTQMQCLFTPSLGLTCSWCWLTELTTSILVTPLHPTAIVAVEFRIR